MGIFRKGIEPIWEDEKNKDGTHLEMMISNVKQSGTQSLEIFKSTSEIANAYWLGAVCFLIADEFPENIHVINSKIKYEELKKKKNFFSI